LAKHSKYIYIELTSATSQYTVCQAIKMPQNILTVYTLYSSLFTIQ